MPNIYRRGFTDGWKPSQDASNASPNALLRADNVVFEDEGIVSSRRGSTLEFNTSDAELTEKVVTVELDDTVRVVSQVGDSVYADGLQIQTDIDGSGPAAFGAANGQMIFTRGDTHKKWDGTTVRNWGIEQPQSPPTVSAEPLASKTIANCSQASGEFTATEGTRSYITGYDGVANGAVAVTPAVGTGRGVLSYTFGSTQNLVNFLGAEGGDFDLFEFWTNDPQPQSFEFLSVVFGISSGSDPFLTDSYIYQFGSELPALAPTIPELQRSEAATPPAQVPPPPESPVPPPDPEPVPDRDRGIPRPPREA